MYNILMSSTMFVDNPQKRKIAVQVRNIHMLIFVLIIALVMGVIAVIINDITDSVSEKLVRLPSIETMRLFNTYMTRDLVLVRKTALSEAIIGWVADEENPAKKAAAYNEMKEFTKMLQNANSYFAIEKSLNEYSINAGISFEDFHSFSRLDRSNPGDAWYFECIDSEYDYILNIDIDKITKKPCVWINHRVMKDNNPIGVFCLGIPFEELAENLFAEHDNKNIKGYIIDKNGYIQFDGAISIFHPEEKNKNSIYALYPNSVFNSAMETYLKGINGYFDLSARSVSVKPAKDFNNYASIVPIVDTDWSVVTFLNKNLLFINILPLIIAVLSSLFIYVLVDSIVMHRLVFLPLNRLTTSLSASKFYIGEIFGCDRGDEIGVLAETIQRMRDRLSTYNAELLRAAREREHLIRIDQLTNIPNRRSFDERLPLEWGRAIRTKTPISLLILDLDHFKKYNDAYGHLQGDKALQATAKIFMQILKRSGDLVARWGGEEFAVLLVNTDIEGALNVAEGIRQNVESLQIPLVDGTISKITVSIGINSLIPETNNLLEDFIRHADMALYTAKKEGRNRVCQYSKGVHLSSFSAGYS